MTRLEDALNWFETATDSELIDDRNEPMLNAVEEAARLVANLRKGLVHHLNERDDPCQDRGVTWPCDVSSALGVTEEK